MSRIERLGRKLDRLIKKETSLNKKIFEKKRDLFLDVNSIPLENWNYRRYETESSHFPVDVYTLNLEGLTVRQMGWGDFKGEIKFDYLNPETGKNICYNLIKQEEPTFPYQRTGNSGPDQLLIFLSNNVYGVKDRIYCMKQDLKRFDDIESKLIKHFNDIKSRNNQN